jgi:hypothetical protein
LIFRRIGAEHLEQGAVDRLGQRLDAGILAILDAVGVEGLEVGDAAAQLGQGGAHHDNLRPRRRRRPIGRIAAHDIRDHQSPPLNRSSGRLWRLCRGNIVSYCG